MRLKSYVAPSMADAMYLVRAELGENAIIVSTQRAANGKGIRITAAAEPDDADEAVGTILAEIGHSAAADVVRGALVDHGLPQRLVDRLVNSIRVRGDEDPLIACTEAFKTGFAFSPLPVKGALRPFLFIGPPGSGKSVSLTKVAANAVINGYKVGVINCDNLRAGANAQLSAFTRILQIDLVNARDGKILASEAGRAMQENDLVLIDSPGLNPFKKEDMDYLADLADAANVEPVLVLSAGGDVSEAAEIGEIFAGVGATRLVATKLDTTRRLGSVIAAAEAGQLMLAGISATPSVANGLTSLTAELLAQMIVPLSLTERASAPAQSEDKT